jgi:hypothetical protein
VLGTVEIVLVTNDAVLQSATCNHSFAHLVFQSHSYRTGRSNIPDGHTRARNVGEADGAGETLVTLGVIVLQADLELDGLEEVTLLGVLRVVQKLLDILTHSGCC